MASVLIIDDDDQLRWLLAKVLELKGYVVAQAADGREGIRVYREAPTDLIILDILLPERDGFEILRDLRREWPSVKIFVMSGAEAVLDFDVLATGKQLGALRTFRKPLELAALVEAVREAVPSNTLP